MVKRFKVPIAEVDVVLASDYDKLESAVVKLLSCVEDKSLPMMHPDNQRVRNYGDTISVNEGNLWALQNVLNRGRYP